MSFYGGMKITHVNASTELKLEQKLRQIEVQHDGMVKVINVYKSGTGYTAWYYHDFEKAGLPKNDSTEGKPLIKKKKVTKKKTRKKAGN